MVQALVSEDSREQRAENQSAFLGAEASQADAVCVSVVVVVMCLCPSMLGVRSTAV
jgi:hypothetical protein